MKKYRIVRDLVLMGLGVAVLFGLFTLINMFGAKKQVSGKSEISNARRVAELSMKRRNWPSAAASNQKLAEQDPYNGHAKFFRATALFQMSINHHDKTKELEKQNASQEEIDAKKKEFVDNAQQACEQFEECTDFARYRNRSRAATAHLQMLMGNTEAALDALELAVKDGYYNRQFGIAGSFRGIQNNPRFRAIAVQENANRARAFESKRPEAFFAK